MRRQNWPVLAPAAVIWIVLVACGGPTSTAALENTSTSASAPGAQTVPATATGPLVEAGMDQPAVSSPAGADAALQAEPETGAPLVAASWDARAIVAAHEAILTDIYSSVLPSVAYVRVENDLASRQPMPFSGSRRAPKGFTVSGEGSAFVWSDQGHVVTNHHVIESADRVTVVLANGSELYADVVGSDPDSDLAVLKIDPPAGGLASLNLGDSGDLKVGQLVVAIGNPFGQEFTMTRGIVSALGRTISSATGYFSNPQAIQTDAPMNPGNSGGPLLDMEGNVVGIASQIISSSGASAGVGFAIPVDTAKRVVPELIANGEYEYAYLGVSGLTLSQRVAEANGLPGHIRGALIVGVVDDGPAEKAGIRAAVETNRFDGVEYPVGGDVITGINGSPVAGIDDLVGYMVENSEPGDEVTLDVLRSGGEHVIVDVVLGSRPEQTAG